MDKAAADIFIQKNNLKLAGSGVVPQLYAIGMPLNSPVLQENLNEALRKLNNNGTLSKLIREYLDIDPNTVLPPAASTTWPTWRMSPLMTRI